ncbi:fibronectin type III-like domain-contianing protein [Streptomyces sp. NPDC001286]
MPAPFLFLCGRAAVPQAYVGRSPDLRLDQAVRVLGGCRRLVLRAGELRRVRVEVVARTLSSSDPKRHDGCSAPVGAPSGADLSLGTASKGGDTLSTTVRREHHCDLWDRLAAG